jgi:hypothetical protein
MMYAYWEVPMFIYRTTITRTIDGGATVEMILSDNEPPEELEEWISFRLNVSLEKNPLLAEVQGVALERAQKLIARESGLLQSRVHSSK